MHRRDNAHVGPPLMAASRLQAAPYRWTNRSEDRLPAEVPAPQGTHYPDFADQDARRAAAAQLHRTALAGAAGSLLMRRRDSAKVGSPLMAASRLQAAPYRSTNRSKDRLPAEVPAPRGTR